MSNQREFRYRLPIAVVRARPEMYAPVLPRPMYSLEDTIPVGLTRVDVDVTIRTITVDVENIEGKTVHQSVPFYQCSWYRMTKRGDDAS